MDPIVIIGSGLAGYTVAREFRKQDQVTPLLIISADDAAFYSKPMLSNAFAQGKQPSQLVSQSAAQMAAQLDARILGKTQVTAIDVVNRTIETSGGAVGYRRLVIAAGARAIRLTPAGDAADAVLSINDINDYAIFRERVAACGERARIAILGAGLIGCEFADDLAGAGHAVTLIDPNPLPLAALAAPALSQGLMAALQARDVDMRLGITAARIDHSGEGLQLTLADGQIIQVDIVLSAVGLRPDLSLAQTAHLRTGRGIVVDSHGLTSAPDIYALGDCAEYADPDGSRVLPYVAPLMTAARAIARTLAGQPTAIDLKPAPVIVKTPSYPMALLPAPQHLMQGGQWQSETESGRMLSRFYDASGTMRGFGLAPREASARQALMAEIGNRTVEITGSMQPE